MSVEQTGVEKTPIMRNYFPQLLGSLREDDRYSERVLRVDRSWGNA